MRGSVVLWGDGKRAGLWRHGATGNQGAWGLVPPRHTGILAHSDVFFELGSRTDSLEKIRMRFCRLSMWFSRGWMRFSREWMRFSREWMRFSREWMRFSRVWMRFSRVWMRFSRVWMRFSREWMRFSRVVRASDSQCHSRNCPGFDPSNLLHSWIGGAADDTVLNTVHKKPKISPFKDSDPNEWSVQEYPDPAV